MAIKKKDSNENEVTIMEIGSSTKTICIIGKSPMIQNSMNKKVGGDLLIPPPKKTAADKASKLKHIPMAEFRMSLHRPSGASFPTAIGVPSAAVKGALCCAAIDIPGAVKSQLGRNVFVLGDYIPLWGIPKLYMAVVRCADMSRTPDIRTRAIIPEWACMFDVEYVTPLLKLAAVVNLLAAAGITQGLGDFRPQKGKGNFGQFRIVSPDDADFRRIVETGGKEAQQAAIDDPEMYDYNTEQLMEHFDAEAHRRGFTLPA